MLLGERVCVGVCKGPYARGGNDTKTVRRREGEGVEERERGEGEAGEGGG